MLLATTMLSARAKAGHTCAIGARLVAVLPSAKSTYSTGLRTCRAPGTNQYQSMQIDSNVGRKGLLLSKEDAKQVKRY